MWLNVRMYFLFGPILKMKEITILNSSLWDEKLRHFTNSQFKIVFVSPPWKSGANYGVTYKLT